MKTSKSSWSSCSEFLPRSLFLILIWFFKSSNFFFSFPGIVMNLSWSLVCIACRSSCAELTTGIACSLFSSAFLLPSFSPLAFFLFAVHAPWPLMLDRTAFLFFLSQCYFISLCPWSLASFIVLFFLTSTRVDLVFWHVRSLTMPAFTAHGNWILIVKCLLNVILTYTYSSLLATYLCQHFSVGLPKLSYHCNAQLANGLQLSRASAPI